MKLIKHILFGIALMTGLFIIFGVIWLALDTGKPIIYLPVIVVCAGILIGIVTNCLDV